MVIPGSILCESFLAEKVKGYYTRNWSFAPGPIAEKTAETQADEI